ncbi:2-oxo acid dehydrogenase subunit E2 [Nocardioides panacis]|uniref:Dihydrolipoamide acetyltransferase component of pyruvate dehydrogenase complex n=1 Tax=Nocardioides panacis TaxID=2849501 RepID=A0A975SX24_9ACTN|nr:dihydrolipoamide acetyltransferase family protein [Nocardioides panacis]QWZ07426.1 2-oxo acid dehydrogenase subunit E2 [Nocardioides panacis]
MAELLRVPEVAAGATEVVLSEWLVKAGDTLTAGAAVAVVETEKAVVEIEAPSGAVLLRLLAESGTEVEVGAPLALLGTAAELDADLDAILEDLGFVGGSAKPAPPRREVPEAEAESPSPGQGAPPQDLDRVSEASPRSPEGPAGSTRLFVSPIARKLLREAGLSPEGLTGSGPNGRIVRKDVEAALKDPARQRASAEQPAAERPVAAVPAEPTAGGAAQGFEEVPHTRLRRAVAARLTQSKQEIPHFYLKGEAVIDELSGLRQQLNEHSPVKLSVNDFVLRAVAVAHTRVPDANVVWTDDAMRRFEHVDVSVAIASERGLVTPVLRGVEGRSLSSISAGVKAFAAAANEGRLQQRDLEGGSISVTNLGMYGVTEFSAIINPPQSAILAVGAARQVPRVVDGQVGVATVMELVLSVDHRAIDGALAAQWMQALVAALEHPLSLVV